MTKTVFYWSPCLSKVGTFKSTINSALSASKYSKGKLSIKIINLLKEDELSIEDIFNLLPLISKKKITDVIEILFENDEIHKLGNKYKSKYTNL